MVFSERDHTAALVHLKTRFSTSVVTPSGSVYINCNLGLKLSALWRILPKKKKIMTGRPDETQHLDVTFETEVLLSLGTSSAVE